MSAGWTRDQMAERAAAEMIDGENVNLGIGLPTLMPGYLTDDVEVPCTRRTASWAQGPTLPRGKVDANLVDAVKKTFTINPVAA
jgi:3-oxoacid CoA-transferase subunit B